MVAKNIALPNIRKILVPDPGYTIVDADLAGADAQVVAWEAGDEELKNAFRAGIKIHVFNARTMWAHETKDMDDEEIKESSYYNHVKGGVHATNYGAKPGALIENFGWTRAFAEEFQDRWFSAHPLIKRWHERYERYLDGTQCWNCDHLDITLGKPCPECGVRLGRTVKNRFGFRRMYFERVEGILPEALAWTPQSTVAFCCELGWTSIDQGPRLSQYINSQRRVNDWSRYLVEPNSYSKWHSMTQFLIQVHDSIVFQVRHQHEKHIPEIVSDMRVKVPYPDELIIPMSYKTSRISWGDA